MKNNYLKRIDKIIDEMITDYNSKKEPLTKIINYEYYQGELFGLYELIEDTETLTDFITCYEYRKEDRDKITEQINNELITPLYNKTRAAN